MGVGLKTAGWPVGRANGKAAKTANDFAGKTTKRQKNRQKRQNGKRQIFFLINKPIEPTPSTLKAYLAVFVNCQFEYADHENHRQKCPVAVCLVENSKENVELFTIIQK